MQESTMPLKTFADTLGIAALFEGHVVNFTRPETFTFAQGIISPGVYLDNRTLASYPQPWDTVIGSLTRQARVLRGKYDVIAAVATGANVHCGVLAWRLKIPLVVVKKEPKRGHGKSGLIDGDVAILRGKRVLLVEDTSTTFESCLRAIRALEEERAQVAVTMLIVTWNLPEFKQNVKDREVYAFCTGEDLIGHAVEHGDIDTGYESILRRWIANPHDTSWLHDPAWTNPKT
jgi:orotate phosphoribosyltransferase